MENFSTVPTDSDIELQCPTAEMLLKITVTFYTSFYNINVVGCEYD